MLSILKRITLTAVLFSNAAFAAPHETLILHAISVGYADAFLIERHPSQKTVMVDAGSYESSGKVVSFLKARGVKEIDMLIITHGHDNHYGGLLALSDQYTIRRLQTNDISHPPEDLGYLLDTLESKGTLVETVRRGDEVEMDNVTRLRILHPDTLTHNPNGNSLVVEIQFKNTFFLFSADITPDVQAEIIHNNLLTQSPDVVTLPHHGDEPHPLFCDFVSSAIKILSTGPYEKRPTPDPKTLERFTHNLFRTDREGDISFYSDGIHIHRWFPETP